MTIIALHHTTIKPVEAAWAVIDDDGNTVLCTGDIDAALDRYNEMTRSNA